MNDKRIPALTAELTADGLVFTSAIGDRFTVTREGLTPEIWERAAWHGLEQKLRDAAAIGRNPENGRSATTLDKWNAVIAVRDRLLGGQWNAVREGGGNGGGLLESALRRLYPAKTPEQLREYLAGKTDAEKTALRGNAKIAAIIEQIRAERGAAARVDTNAMLDELGEM